MRKEPIINSEDQLLAACFQWTWREYPEYRRLFFHVKNEGYKHGATAAQDHGKGLVAGIPDIVWIAPVAMGIELKWGNGRQSEGQTKVQDAWEKAGVPYYIVRSLDEYKAIVVMLTGTVRNG